LPFPDAKIGIFHGMAKYGFTSFNGEFEFSENAKRPLADDNLFEGDNWRRELAETMSNFTNPN
jgi:hypothetical protein